MINIFQDDEKRGSFSFLLISNVWFNKELILMSASAVVYTVILVEVYEEYSFLSRYILEIWGIF